jgi:phosphatidylserine decarboxylase
MSMRDVLKPVMVPINQEGWSFVALFAIVSVLLGMLIGDWFFYVGGLLTVWCAYFFRDPDRFTPTRLGLIISPADGVVQMIRKATPPPELEMGDKALTRVSVFMNVFNVHVNRAPCDGTITKLSYRPGKFLNASLDKASVDNERQSYLMETTNGKQIAFVQIAGLVARRILPQVEPGEEMLAGQRFGLIRFGSRVDVFLPEGVVPLVCEGQLTIAGETVLADMGCVKRGKEGAREGAIR